MEFNVTYLCHLTYPERLVQTTHTEFLLLCLSGLDYMRFTPPGGGQQLAFDAAQLPFLALLPRGTVIDFSFNERRENLVAIGNVQGIQTVPGHCMVQFSMEHGLLQFPFARSLPPQKARHLREAFLRIGELRATGLPANAAAADCLATGICAEWMAQPNARPMDDSPAERLRQAIQTDMSFQRPMRDIYREAGASAPVLRRAFQNAYQIAPEEFRLRMKMDRILDLIDQNNLALKEIAAAVGMRNVTHLHAFVRQRCGMSPGTLQRQRQGIASVNTKNRNTKEECDCHGRLSGALDWRE